MDSKRGEERQKKTQRERERERLSQSKKGNTKVKDPVCPGLGVKREDLLPCGHK